MLLTSQHDAAWEFGWNWAWLLSGSCSYTARLSRRHIVQLRPVSASRSEEESPILLGETVSSAIAFNTRSEIPSGTRGHLWKQRVSTMQRKRAYAAAEPYYMTVSTSEHWQGLGC